MRLRYAAACLAACAALALGGARAEWYVFETDSPPEALLEAAMQVSGFSGEVTLSFLGDCTLGGEDWLVNREGSFHDYARKKGYGYFFEKVRDFFAEDDLTIVNFEGVLKDDARDAVNKTYCFRGPTDFANILTLSSIEAVNLDNNHTLDYGKRGKTSTVEALTGAGVHVFDELTPYIFEKDGIKIAFFGMQRVHFYTLREQLTEQMRVLREEEGVNAIIFAQHTGTEYALSLIHI